MMSSQQPWCEAECPQADEHNDVINVREQILLLLRNDLTFACTGPGWPVTALIQTDSKYTLEPSQMTNIEKW